MELVRAQALSVLAGMGFMNVQCADGGLTALKALEVALCQGQGFELVLCDWNMPEMDGVELLRAAQKVPQLKRIPFIMVTAEVNTRNIVDAITAGAVDYIVKPFTKEAFGKKLRDLNARLAKRAA